MFVIYLLISIYVVYTFKVFNKLYDAMMTEDLSKSDTKIMILMVAMVALGWFITIPLLKLTGFYEFNEHV